MHTYFYPYHVDQLENYFLYLLVYIGNQLDNNIHQKAGSALLETCSKIAFLRIFFWFIVYLSGVLQTISLLLCP
jgi:hypothetical protein